MKYLMRDIHGDNIKLDMQILKYLFWAWILTHRDPDLLDAIMSLIGRVL